MGPRLAAYTKAKDPRQVRTREPTKSISAETTFGKDLSALDDLQPYLTRLVGRVSSRAQRSGKPGWVVTIKLKTEDFRTFTRRQKMAQPTFDKTILRTQAEAMLRGNWAVAPFDC